MDADLYTEFRNFADRGERRKAAEYVVKFIDSFRDDAEKKVWVRAFLEGGDYGHKIRHELYRDLIFPELNEGYLISDPWSLYFLARTIQNVYSAKELRGQLDRETDYSLLLTCFKKAPDYRDVKKRLLERVGMRLNFAIHEWPQGLCCEIGDVESELALGKSLDSEDSFSLMFDEVEAILAEAKERHRD